MNTTLSSEIDLLLQKLASDDDFRARLLADPAAALHSIGVDLPRDQIPARIVLPAKAALARDRMAIHDKLDSAAGAIPFYLSGKL